MKTNRTIEDFQVGDSVIDMLSGDYMVVTAILDKDDKVKCRCKDHHEYDFNPWEIDFRNNRYNNDDDNGGYHNNNYGGYGGKRRSYRW